MTPMVLPNRERAVVGQTKITQYLLSDAHPLGRDKASLLRQFGFQIVHWQQLAGALAAHARDHAVTSLQTTEYGVKYVVDGPLRTPDGRRPNFRSIWFIEAGSDTPRFVSAYPLKGPQ